MARGGVQIGKEDYDPDISPEVSAQTSPDKPSEPQALHLHRIDLFMWLRLITQVYHEEQSYRKAAVKLMFDTASTGALAAKVGKLNRDSVEMPGCVDFPQFTAICKTLWPSVGIAEIGRLYSEAWNERPGKGVDVSSFFRVAERAQFFSRALTVSVPTSEDEIESESLMKGGLLFSET
jgi:hypothetical protein